MRYHAAQALGLARYARTMALSILHRNADARLITQKNQKALGNLRLLPPLGFAAC